MVARRVVRCSLPSADIPSRPRKKYRDDVLVFTGLEWNIPAGEHTTLMLAPGDNEAALLQEFVTGYDARVNGSRDGTPANEAIALEALRRS